MENPLKVSLENIIPLTEARDHFSQIVTEVQQDKLYVLTKGGKPAVAIVDVKYLEHITGGQAKVEEVKEEIKKAPEKVGLPPMVEHKPQPPTFAEATVGKPAPPPSLPPESLPPKPATAPPTPPTPPSVEKVEPPKPTFAEATVGKPPAPPSIPPMEQKPPTPPLTTPPKSSSPDKIDIQYSQDSSGLDKSSSKGDTASEDKTSPAQYAGQSEPQDMALD